MHNKSAAIAGSFNASLTCLLLLWRYAVGCHSRSNAKNVLFDPRDHQLHFWLEETPTQPLNRFDFLKITSAPAAAILLLLSDQFPWSHTFRSEWDILKISESSLFWSKKEKKKNVQVCYKTIIPEVVVFECCWKPPKTSRLKHPFGNFNRVIGWRWKQNCFFFCWDGITSIFFSFFELPSKSTGFFYISPHNSVKLRHFHPLATVSWTL